MSVARGCSLCQSLGIIDPQNYCLIIVPTDLKVDSRLSPFVRSWLNGAIQTERVLYSSSAPLFLVFRTGYSSTLSMSRSLFLGLRSMTSWRIVSSRLLSQQLHAAMVTVGNAEAYAAVNPPMENRP